MPLRQAISFAVSLSKCLEQGHSKKQFGLIRPGNIEVDRNGCARFIDPNPKVQSADVAYCSPEEWAGKPIDARSDIFSFGVIFFEALSGTNPFLRDSFEATRTAVTGLEVPSLQQRCPELPDVIDFLVSRCLRKDPERRFQNASQLRGALEELEAQITTEASVPSRSDPTKHGYRLLLLIGIAVGLLLATGLWLAFSGGQRGDETPMNAVALLSNTGTIVSPSFSPAGDQVAFSWNGERGDNYDIYVKPVGPGAAIRLTTNADMDVSPVWSPDGRYLAFVRNNGPKAAIYLLPLSGGSERKLHEFLRTSMPSRYRLLAWSPDGRWLAFPASPDGKKGGSIFLLSLESGGEVRQLTYAPEDSAFGDSAPAFAPDARQLAFVRTYTGNVGDIFLLPLSAYRPAGDPQRLTSTGAVTNPAWTVKGSELLFTRFQGTSVIWRMEPNPAAKAGAIPGIGELGNFADVTHPREGSTAPRMVYVRSVWDENIWRVPVLRGKAQAQPEAIVTSTRRDWEPHFGPEPSKVSFASERSGSAEVWISDVDGNNPRRLTSMSSFAAAARWSPDGTRIAFVTDKHGQYEIYYVDVASGAIHRLTDSPSHETAPNWSRDGRFIYFASNRSGRFQIWKQTLEPNATAVQVTDTEGFAAIESLDGKQVFFTKQSPAEGIWVRPIEGGEEKQIVPSISAWGNFAVCADGIYYSTAKEPKRVQYYSFSKRQSTTVLDAPKNLGFGLAISADGRTLLFTSIDQQSNELMLVESFR
jgi:eukaryotic-like serine/threonine-protein kinase